MGRQFFNWGARATSWSCFLVILCGSAETSPDSTAKDCVAAGASLREVAEVSGGKRSSMRTTKKMVAVLEGAGDMFNSKERRRLLNLNAHRHTLYITKKKEQWRRREQ